MSINSRLATAYRATDWTSSGSNLAESSSFATVRAMLIPSDIPGGARTPPENACPTASLRRFDERDRYRDSKLDNARRIRTVSVLPKVV